MRELALFRRHGLERQTLAHFGNEEPIAAFFVLEIERRLLALFGCERLKKLVGGGRHFLARHVAAANGGNGKRKERQKQRWFHACNSTTMVGKRNLKIRVLVVEIGWKPVLPIGTG